MVHIFVIIVSHQINIGSSALAIYRTVRTSYPVLSRLSKRWVPIEIESQTNERKILKMIKLSVAAAALALGVASTSASAQESEGHMLEMTKFHLEPVSWFEFGAGMEAYIDCHKENELDSSWSAWVDMEHPVVWMVSRMDNWAELDGPGLGPCYSIIEEQMSDAIRDIETQFARHMPDWSTSDDNDPGVVALWQFSVDDGRKFREAASEIFDIVRENGHDRSSWYEMLGEGGGDINFFLVNEFENFAEMDTDAPTPARVLREAVGQPAARALWERMWSTLDDDGEGYDRVMLRKIPGWSHDPDAE